MITSGTLALFNRINWVFDKSKAVDFAARIWLRINPTGIFSDTREITPSLVSFSVGGSSGGNAGSAFAADTTPDALSVATAGVSILDSALFPLYHNPISTSRTTVNTDRMATLR